MRQFTLRFLVRKWANSFFLIDNLAFPIDSMHEDYNREWIESFGRLSNAEENALERYRGLKKSIWDKGRRKLLDRFEASFYQSPRSDPKEGKTLQKILTKDQLQELNVVFRALRDRFQSMWGESEKTLSQGQSLLKREFSYVQQDFNQSFSAIGKLYGVDNFSKQVEVYLMMRPYPGFVGGRMVSRQPSPKIMVESGIFDPQNPKQKSHLWLLLLHELTHACFENDKFFEFLDGYLGGKPPLAQFLEKYPATKTPVLATRRAMIEMIVNSIVLNSYVRGRFEQHYTGGPKDGEALLEKVRNYLERESLESPKGKRRALLPWGRWYIAWRLEKVVRPYLDKEQEIDKQFLDSAYKILEKFPDNLLEDLKFDR